MAKIQLEESEEDFLARQFVLIEYNRKVRVVQLGNQNESIWDPVERNFERFFILEQFIPEVKSSSYCPIDKQIQKGNLVKKITLIFLKRDKMIHYTHYPRIQNLGIKRDWSKILKTIKMREYSIVTCSQMGPIQVEEAEETKFYLLNLIKH